SGLTIRVTAAWLSGLLLGGTGAVARAGALRRVDAPKTSPQPDPQVRRDVAATTPKTPAKEPDRVWTVPVVPKRLAWITASTVDPWTFFDGGLTSAQQGSGQSEWDLAVTLDAPTALGALTVHGPVRGTLTAFAKEASGLRAISGWTDRKVVVPGPQW